MPANGSATLRYHVVAREAALAARASALCLRGRGRHAQTIVTSAAPDHVAVTVYRDPDRARPSSARISAGWTAMRWSARRGRSRFPAGETEIRFEGVAGGIIPQSAIVTGLPEGIVERNRDAYLLSPATLLDRSLGRRVHLRRTSPRPARSARQEAMIRSGAGGAVVLQTRGRLRGAALHRPAGDARL